MRAVAFALASLGTAVLLVTADAADTTEELFRAAPTGSDALDSVPALDDHQRQLTQGIWRVYLDAKSAHPDARGRLPRDDVNQWLMTDAALARLAALRARAAAAASAHQEAERRAALSEAATLLEQERDRLYLIWAYWGQQQRIAAHAAQFQALVARLPAAASASPSASIDAALKELESQYTLVLAAAEGGVAQQDAARGSFELALQHLFDTYNSERGTLGVAVSAAEREAGHDAPFRTRVAPCPAPVTETSANERPALQPVATSPDSFYPAHARAMGFEGFILLQAEVSAGGCIEKVSVYESSGVPELDQAAIDWALAAARMRPAQRDHRAVAGELRFRMNFRLRG